ncbi:MAG: HAMP domain-containing protein [Proteobacteria bacterium]|nr:MAG: HAMP domain-containing protein [Pseudomonadota bacterium]
MSDCASNDRVPVGRKRRHRLSIRLLMLFLAMGMLFIVIIAGLFRGAWRYHFDDAVRPHFEQYVHYLADDIGTPPDLDAAARLADTLPVDISVSGPGISWSSLGSAFDEGRIRVYHHHDSTAGGYELGEYDDDRFVARFLKDGYRIDLLTETVERGGRGTVVMLIMMTLVLLVLYAAYRVIRLMLKPIEELENGVSRLGAGELDYRIDIPRDDELGALAKAINRMADDIEKMLEAKRELLFAISHELRSPLTRANVSLALLKESRHKEELSCDLAEMAQLLGELLEAERLNTRHASLNLQTVPLVELVADVIGEFFADAAIVLDLPDDPLPLRIDTVRVRLLVRNLVDNALRHNRPEKGPVTLRLFASNGTAHIVVEDHGEGLPPECLAHAAEPFWRGDKARRRSTGGFGLGLYLCRRIAEAHGGSMIIESERNRWTRVTALLPSDATTQVQSEASRRRRREANGRSAAFRP